jgi:hypothetical protein
MSIKLAQKGPDTDNFIQVLVFSTQVRKLKKPKRKKKLRKKNQRCRTLLDRGTAERGRRCDSMRNSAKSFKLSKYLLSIISYISTQRVEAGIKYN